MAAPALADGLASSVGQSYEVPSGLGTDFDLAQVFTSGANAADTDDTAPTVSTAEVTAAAPKELVVSFNEALDTGSVPSASAFAVKIGGNAGPGVSSAAIDGGDATKLKLGLAEALDASQTSVTLDYTNPGAGNNPLQDAAENKVASFAGQAVTNNAPACPSGQPADAFWTACLTVEQGSIAYFGFLVPGFLFTVPGGIGDLSNKTFTLDNATYTVDGLAGIGNIILLSFTSASRPASETWILQVGSDSFAIDEASFYNPTSNTHRWINASGDYWTAANIGDKVSVSLRSDNAFPTASDNTVTTKEDESYTFTAADFNFGDADDGDTLASVKIVTLETEGELELDGTAVTENQVISSGDIIDGDLVFSPAADGNGDDYASFTFKVNDGDNDSIDAYTMTINVDSVPDVTQVWVSSTPRSGTADPKDTYGVGEEIQMTILFDEAVSLTGAPVLQIQMGNSGETPMTKEAASRGGVATTAVVFEYTVQSQDSDDDGIEIAANGLQLNGGTIQDLSGNAADLRHDQLGVQSDHKVDGSLTPPPLVREAEVTAAQPKELVVSFDKTLDTGSVPTGALFDVKIDGNPGPTVLSVAIDSGDTTRLKLGLAYALTAADENVTLDYSQPVSNPLQHGAKSRVVSFSGQRVSNAAPPCPAGQPADAFWTACLTVGKDGNRFGLSGSSGELSSSTFTVDGATYTIDILAEAVSNMILSFTADPRPPADTWILQVGSHAFAVEDAASYAEAVHSYVWRPSAVDWGNANRGDKVSVSLRDGNTPPTASDNTVTTKEDESYTFTPGDFNFEDADASHSLKSVKIVTLETEGELELNDVAVTKNQAIAYDDIDNGHLVFSPAEDAHGSPYDSFVFKVNDGYADSVNDYTMTINVEPGAADVTQVLVTSRPRSRSGGGNSPKDTYGEGEEIQVTVTFEETVRVTGAPVFQIRMGNSGETPKTKEAAYVGGSETAALVFAYTVQAADEDDNGIYIEANALRLSGGTIQNDAGTAADLDHPLLGGQSNHKVDGSLTPPVPPSVSGAEVTAAQPKQLLVSFDKALDTSSVPASSAFTVKIDGGDGPGVSSVAIDSGDATRLQLALAYALAAEDVNVTVAYINPGPANNPLQDTEENEVMSFSNQMVSNNAPACPSGQPADAFWTACLTLGRNAARHINLGFDGQGNVGYGDLRDNSFTLDSTTYTVDVLQYFPRFGTMTFSLSADPRPASTSWILQIGSHSFPMPAATYFSNTYDYEWSTSPIEWTGANVGDKVSVSLRVGVFPEAADGTVTTNEDEAYTFTPSEFNFSPAEPGDTLASVKIVTLETEGELELNGMEVTTGQVITYDDIDNGHLVFTPAEDASGDPYASFRFKVNDGEYDSIAAYTMTINVEPVAEVTQVAVTSRPRSRSGGGNSPKDTYGEGEPIQVTVSFDEVVTVTGAPVFSIEMGAGGDTPVTRDAAYVSGSASTALAFAYTVQASDTDDDGIAIAANALQLNGGTIQNASGGQADLNHPQLAEQSGHKVDGSLTPPVPPSVSGAVVTAAQPKQLLVSFDKALDTSSVPARSAFTVKIDGNAGPRVSSVAIDSGDATRLQLGLAHMLTADDANVTLDYTSPVTNPLQDAAANEVMSFTDRAVANNAPACPSEQPADAFWTACLTIEGDIRNTGQHGFIGTEGDLSDKTFTVDNATYTVDGLAELNTVMILSFTADPRPAAASWILQVGSHSFAIDEADSYVSSTNTYVWERTPIRWRSANEGDKVSVSLRAAPVVAAAEVTAASPKELVVSFDRALDTTSVPAPAAFTVRLEGIAGPAVSSVAIDSGDATRLQLGLAHMLTAADANVTLTYAKPASDPLRDAANNKVASFSDQPVANNAPACGQDEHQPDDFWSACLTVETSGNNFGYDSTAPYGALSDNAPAFDGAAYPLTGIVLNSSGELELRFQNPAPSWLVTGGWRLKVGDNTPLSINDAALQGNLYRWPSPGLSWANANVGDKVSMSLVRELNQEATGQPTITGAAVVGQALTAGTANLADDNGLTRAANGVSGYAYAYQWIHVDNGSDTDIPGATASTYTLVADDLGKSVKVKVSFKDDANYNEERTSTATGPVTPADATAPRVTSINRQAPPSSLTNADTLTWRVAFNEEVQNVDATDFTVNGTTATLSLSEATTGTVYDVTASDGDLANLNATVTLGFASGQDIQDTANNLLTDTVPTLANDNTYAVDNNAPAFSSAVVQPRAPKELVITFNENLVDTTPPPAATAFTVQAGVNPRATATSVAVSGDQEVTLIMAAAFDSSEVPLTVAYDKPVSNPLRDAANNEVATFSDQSVINNAPVCGQDEYQPNDFWSACLTVGASGNNFGYDSTAPYGALSDNAPTFDGAAYPLTGIVLNSSGELELRFQNPPPSPSVAGGWQLKVGDNAALAINDAALQGDLYHWPSAGFRWGNANVGDKVSVSLAQTSNQAATGQPTITGAAVLGQVLTASKGSIADNNGLTRADNGDSGYGYTYQWIRVAGDSETDIPAAASSTYTLVADDLGKTVKVRVSFKDDANYNEERSSAETATVTATDTTAPQVTSIDRQTPPSSPTNADTLTWRVAFNEDVKNVDATDFTVNGTTATLSLSEVTAGTVYDVTASGGDLANLNATVTLGFASSQDIQDTANNTLTDTVPMVTNHNTYTVDNMAPTLTIAVPATSTEPFTATFSFSEPVEGFAMDDVTVTNGTASAFTVTTPDEEWTALITPAASGAVTVAVGAGVVTDVAGNATTAAAQAVSTYTASGDGTPPPSGDPDATREGAVPLPAIETTQGEPSLYGQGGALDPANGDVIDYYSFTVPTTTTSQVSGQLQRLAAARGEAFPLATAQQVAIQVTGRSDLMAVTLEDNQGRPMATASTTTDNPSLHQINTLLEPGVYYIKVEATEAVPMDYDLRLTLTTPPPSPSLSVAVADARVEEGAAAFLQFQVTLDRPATATVTVDYASEDDTATAGTAGALGADYVAASGILTFQAGEKEQTVSVVVLEDALEEGEERMRLRLSNPSAGLTIRDGEATGVITETNAVPIDWLARFGRTVTDQVLEAVEQRLKPGRQEGVQVQIAGQAVPVDGNQPAILRLDGNEEQPAQPPLLERWLLSRKLPSAQEWVTGSSFALTTTEEDSEEEKGNGGHLSLWGLGAIAGFDGRQHDFSLDGQVTTALMGTDWATGQWTAGLALGRSTGTGHYRQSDCATDRCSGDIEATLTGLYPYVGGVQHNDRRTLWAAAGYSMGDLTLRSPNGKRLSTDLTMTMGAAGLRSQLAAPEDNGDGFSLAVKGDARFTRTSSKELPSAEGSLSAAEADIWRLRVGIEAARPMTVGAANATVTPSFEMGLRLDGGDADTGFGTDIGAGVVLANPRNGIHLDLAARGLVAHETADFQEWGAAASLSWDPQPDTEQGFSAQLTQSWGASPSGGMEALLQRQSMAEVAATDGNGEAVRFVADSRLEAELGYGLPLWDGAFTLTPNIGFAFSETVRDYRIGWRLSPAPPPAAAYHPLELELELDVTRSESTDSDAPATHGVMLRSTLLW